MYNMSDMRHKSYDIRVGIYDGKYNGIGVTVE